MGESVTLSYLSLAASASALLRQGVVVVGGALNRKNAPSS
jgi:hypothetical protein